MKNIHLSVRDLQVNFDIHQNKKWPWSKPQVLNAVNGVSFDLYRGQTLGIVGESGCGKSTLIRAIAGLYPPSRGEVAIEGETIDYKNRNSLISLRRKIQMIFQDPIASLNPRMTIGETMGEPLDIFFPNLTADEKNRQIIEMLDRVGISRQNLGRFPHEFSGGQCQRIGIARALMSKPEILLCDEPVSALDVSVQAQVVNLLVELQNEMGLSIVFVAHDLGIIHHISDHVLVMYLGGKMEYATAGEISEQPFHPYTKALLSAAPRPDPNYIVEPQILEGELPSPLSLPKGCLFSTRCPIRTARCETERPKVRTYQDHEIACLEIGT